MAISLHTADARKVLKSKINNKLRLLTLAHLPANLTAMVINRAIWPVITYHSLYSLPSSFLAEIQASAQRCIRKALVATTSFKSEKIIDDLENGGLGLEKLELTMATRTINTIKSILNAEHPTGFRAVTESLSAAIGLPGYSQKHRQHFRQLGPFEFSYNDDGHEQSRPEYLAHANKHFPYKPLKEAISRIKNISGVDIRMIWNTACICTFSNAIPRATLDDSNIIQRAATLGKNKSYNGCTQNTFPL